MIFNNNKMLPNPKEIMSISLHKYIMNDNSVIACNFLLAFTHNIIAQFLIAPMIFGGILYISFITELTVIESLQRTILYQIFILMIIIASDYLLSSRNSIIIKLLNDCITIYEDKYNSEISDNIAFTIALIFIIMAETCFVIGIVKWFIVEVILIGTYNYEQQFINYADSGGYSLVIASLLSASIIYNSILMGVKHIINIISILNNTNTSSKKEDNDEQK